GAPPLRDERGHARGRRRRARGARGEARRDPRARRDRRGRRLDRVLQGAAPASGGTSRRPRGAVIARLAGWAFAAALALGLAAPASAQSIPDNDFAIDLAQGLASGTGRQVGMGNAFTALAAGLDGVAFNPASAAMRSLSELKRVEVRGGGGISFPGRFGTGDFFNNGLGSTRGVNIDDSFVLEGGLGFQLGMIGVVGTGEVQSYIVRGREGRPDSNVNLQTFRVGGGFNVLGGDVVLGASLLITRMAITSGLGLGLGVGALVRTSAPGMEIG